MNRTFSVGRLARSRSDTSPSVHARHHHVGDQDVDGVLERLGQLDRFVAAGGFEDGVAMSFEREPREPSHGVFVLDQQHGLPSD